MYVQTNEEMCWQNEISWAPIRCIRLRMEFYQEKLWGLYSSACWTLCPKYGPKYLTAIFTNFSNDNDIDDNKNNDDNNN
jgi:hypothetical protein